MFLDSNLGILFFRFPLILSIENHCSVKQQRVMAKYFKEILQGTLPFFFVPENSLEGFNNFVVVLPSVWLFFGWFQLVSLNALWSM